ncbi:hypothetical protein HMPREF1581_00442 [Gardnerella vaginalis JCP8108]|uniref:Uncharacterized protein n=1 Tax=Gardnerella vaginalis JCP8108 TaxID=1261066 RepID=S4GIG4_GARVA|nr:hypothetical protein HMPREF1581_00442 [Gardnerella vaginalis JCP8108]
MIEDYCFRFYKIFPLIFYFCLHLYFYSVSIKHNTNRYRKFYDLRFWICD